MSENSITNNEPSASEDILLGNTVFRFIESPGKTTVIDLDNKKGIDVYGSFDVSAVKKDLTEQLKMSSFKVNLMDVNSHINNNMKNNNDIYNGITKTEHIHTRIKDSLLSPSLIKPEPKSPWQLETDRMIETAKLAGRVQGVCEAVHVVSGYDQNMGKKLLSEMNITKDMAKKYANPETYKLLENGIFAQKQEQKLELARGIKR